MAESEEELKNRSMKVKEESEEVGLKLNIEKTKTIWSPHFMANRCGGGAGGAWEWKQWQILFSWDLKSLRMVIAAMKLKDACSLEEKI